MNEISVMQGLRFNGQPNWNEFDDNVSNEFDTTQDDITNDEDIELARVLQALQNQWHQVEEAFENELEGPRKLRALRRIRL